MAVSSAPNCPDSNQPPVIQRVVPARYDQREATAAIGRPLTLTVDVADPEGTPLQVSVIGLPEGAHFSDELRTLSWTPSQSQRGMHPLRFVVSDGCKEPSRLLGLLVTDNRAPIFQGAQRSAFIGQPMQLSLAAADADGDALTYTVTGLWRNATFDPSTALLSFVPGEADEGQHSLRVTASDGALGLPWCGRAGSAPRAVPQAALGLLRRALASVYASRKIDYGRAHRARNFGSRGGGWIGHGCVERAGANR